MPTVSADGGSLSYDGALALTGLPLGAVHCQFEYQVSRTVTRDQLRNWLTGNRFTSLIIKASTSRMLTFIGNDAQQMPALDMFLSLTKFVNWCHLRAHTRTALLCFVTESFYQATETRRSMTLSRLVLCRSWSTA